MGAVKNNSKATVPALPSSVPSTSVFSGYRPHMAILVLIANSFHYRNNPLKRVITIIFNLCMCLCLCVSQYMCIGEYVSTEARGFFGVWVTSSCELPNMVLGTELGFSAKVVHTLKGIALVLQIINTLKKSSQVKRCPLTLKIAKLSSSFIIFFSPNRCIALDYETLETRLSFLPSTSNGQDNTGHSRNL